MGQRRIDITELRRRMRVAVEREEASGVARACGQNVVEVLTRRIAVDFDRYVLVCGSLEHGVPVGDDARTRSGDASARMSEDLDARRPDGTQHSRGLVLEDAQ